MNDALWLIPWMIQMSKYALYYSHLMTHKHALPRWQSEERFHQGMHNFPFKTDKEFQLAIFLDEDRFRVAKDGNHLLNYSFKSVQSTQLRVSSSHPIYEKLTGFKIFAKNGLDIIVSYVDYFSIKQNDSKFYEMFSNMNFI